MPFLRKYGVATATGTHIAVPIIKRGVVDNAVGADWTPASGDVTIRKDDGSAANIATLPTAKTMGNTAHWEFQLSAAELQCKKLEISVADAATPAVENQTLLIETFGDPSAMYPTDFSAVILAVNTTQISGDSTAADNLETMLDGTGGQTLTLGQLRINSSAAGGGIDIDNSAGPAISAQSSAADALSLVSTGADGHGFYAAGNGGGDGLHALGGATGHGIHGTGGSTSGHGMRITAPTEGDGLEAAGAGAGKDIDADLSGSVASVVGTVTVGTNNDKTGYSLATTPPTAAQVRAEMDANSTKLADILTDTAEIGTAGAGLTAVASASNLALVKSDTAAILADTGTDGVVVAVGSKTGYELSGTGVTAVQSGLSTLTEAQVNTQVDTALADIHLDHLLATTYDPASKPGAADALLNELVESDSGVARFTANALEQAPGGGGSITVTISYSTVAAALAAAVEAGTITFVRGDRNSRQVTGMGTIPAGRDKLWFTVKHSKGDTDAESIIQITETGGLLYLNGLVPGAAGTAVSGLTSADGSLTVDDATDGDVTVVLSAAAASLLEFNNNHVYDFQYQDGTTVLTLANGKAKVSLDVTRATS